MTRCPFKYRVSFDRKKCEFFCNFGSLRKEWSDCVYLFVALCMMRRVVLFTAYRFDRAFGRDKMYV